MQPEPGTLQVKGGSIRSKFTYVETQFGAEALAELKASVDGLAGLQILEASWYDYDLFNRILQAIADRHFGSDLTRLRDLGRFSAKHALTTTYQAFLGRRDLHGFLSRLSKFHTRFYSQGTLTVVDRQPNSCKLQLLGAPVYLQPDLEVAAGFFAGASEMMDCRDARCTIERPPQSVVFHLSWQ